ncbi:hypothetical protein GOP47_0029083 [Adiantum capillus-veneris]|nr:hypothetical protein GOP47_0029083 [Adiantum capillus-veneris]
MTHAPASPADPSSFLRALGSCPPITLVQAAHFALSRLDTDLATKLTTLHQSPQKDEEEEGKLREEAEKAKLPYKSVVSLYELHQIYEGLVSTCSQDSRTKKTLEVLNSFSDKHARTDSANLSASCDVAKTVLELGANNQNSNTKMDLSNRLLSSLPTSLGHNFTNLISLDLSKNQLKELPCSIGDLDRLEVLDLQSNQLSSLPDAIGFLENLRYLNVSGNMLVNLPESIGGCRNIVELNVGFNQLQRLPTRIGLDLQSLKNLCVHSNRLTCLPTSICELKHLKFLDLHFNNIQSLPSSLGNMSALEKLNISNNFSDFGGSLPDSLADLVLLVELDMSFNQLRALPDCVGALLNLKTLKIENNPLMIPPPEIVSRGTATVLEYMAMRWRTAQTFEEDVCSSPSRANGFKVGLLNTACAGSSLVRWLSWKRGARHTLPASELAPLQGK